MPCCMSLYLLPFRHPMTLARQLQSWGHDVTAAEDGQAAWEKFAAGGFDLVLTDWEMPRLSGVEPAKVVKEILA